MCSKKIHEDKFTENRKKKANNKQVINSTKEWVLEQIKNSQKPAVQEMRKSHWYFAEGDKVKDYTGIGQQWGK